MDDADVRYIVQEACRNVRNELQEELDRLGDEIAKLHCRLEVLEGSETMSAADWRRFAEVGGLDQFSRKEPAEKPPTSLGKLFEDAANFAASCREHSTRTMSARETLSCFLEHRLKEEPEENAADIERIEDMLEDPGAYPETLGTIEV